jgi:glycosyl transferase family 25
MDAYVINLKRRTDRKKHILKNYIHKHIYNLNIIDAYDGKFPENNTEILENIKKNFLININNNKQNISSYNYLSFNNFTSGELGLFVSNIYIWKKMLNENIKNAIIFEDDCIFDEEFENRFPNIIKELPIDYIICFIGGKMCKNYNNNLNINFSNNISIKKENSPFGTFSYILSVKGAEILLNYAFNEFRGKLGLDYFIDEFLNKNNIPIYLSTPLLVYSYSSKNKGTIFDTDIQ